MIEPAALWPKRRTRIFCLNNLSWSGSFRSPNTAPFQFTVCRSCMCGYLLFGLRIPRVAKFPWMFGYGKTFAESQFSHHLLPEISRPGPRTCRVYSCIFNIFVQNYVFGDLSMLILTVLVHSLTVVYGFHCMNATVYLFS